MFFQSKLLRRGLITFRRDVIGDWRNHFNQAHIAAFKHQGGQHLIDLGYERDLDW